MANFILTQKAVLDLSDIWNYTFDEWSEKRANKYYLELLESCETLAQHPEFGKKYLEIRNDLFGYLSGKHIIFFRKISNSEIEITRILHQKMDIKDKFQLE